MNDFSGSFPLAQQTVIPFYQHYVHDLKDAGKSHFKAGVLSHLLNAAYRGSGQRSFLVSFTTFPLVTKGKVCMYVSMTHMYSHVHMFYRCTFNTDDVDMADDDVTYVVKIEEKK